MSNIPPDVLKYIEENAMYIKAREAPSINKELIELIQQASKYMDNVRISDALNMLRSVQYANVPNDLKYLRNEIDSNYYKNLINIYPDLYFSYNKNKNKYSITDKNLEGNSIPVENAKDLVLINNLLGGVEFSECTDFINYLSEFPMLGFKHPVGKRIYKYIEECPREQIVNTLLFRVRVSSNQKQIAYTVNEMFEPQYTIPKQNRFSMVGLNPLYLADSLNTALIEARVTEIDKYTLIKIIVKTPFTILNITNDQIPLFNLCHKKTESINANMYVEYLIPNYISDCAKACDYEGIIYNSVNSLVNKNYVLFNPGKRDFTMVEIKGINY